MGPVQTKPHTALLHLEPNSNQPPSTLTVPTHLQIPLHSPSLNYELLIHITTPSEMHSTSQQLD